MTRTFIWPLVLSATIGFWAMACEEEFAPESSTYSLKKNDRAKSLKKKDPLKIIDVVMVYTPSALKEQSSPNPVDKDYMKRVIAKEVQKTNKVYKNLGFIIRVVHTEVFDFGSAPDETNIAHWGEDKQVKKLLNFVVSRRPDGTDLQSLKQDYGADLVGLIYERTSDHADADWGCGYAFINSASLSYFVIPRVCNISGPGCTSGKIVPYQMAHEIGHNLGLHDDTKVKKEGKKKTRTIMQDPPFPQKCYERIGEFSKGKDGNQEKLKKRAKGWEGESKRSKGSKRSKRSKGSNELGDQD